MKLNKISKEGPGGGMVDTPVLETGVRKDVRVRISPWVQNIWLLRPTGQDIALLKRECGVRIPQGLQKGWVALVAEKSRLLIW